MKTHVRFAALALLIAALVFAWANRKQEFFLLMAIALELYALTEMQMDWREKIELQKWKAFITRRHRSSISGGVAQGAAYLCLVGFFVAAP